MCGLQLVKPAAGRVPTEGLKTLPALTKPGVPLPS